MRIAQLHGCCVCFFRVMGGGLIYRLVSVWLGTRVFPNLEGFFFWERFFIPFLAPHSDTLKCLLVVLQGCG